MRTKVSIAAFDLRFGARRFFPLAFERIFRFSRAAVRRDASPPFLLSLDALDARSFIAAAAPAPAPRPA